MNDLQGALTGQSTQQPTRADHTDMSKAYGAASMGSAGGGTEEEYSLPSFCSLLYNFFQIITDAINSNTFL